MQISIQNTNYKIQVEESIFNDVFSIIPHISLFDFFILLCSGLKISFWETLYNHLYETLSCFEINFFQHSYPIQFPIKPSWKINFVYISFFVSNEWIRKTIHHAPTFRQINCKKSTSFICFVYMSICNFACNMSKNVKFLGKHVAVRHVSMILSKNSFHHTMNHTFKFFAEVW